MTDGKILSAIVDTDGTFHLQRARCEPTCNITGTTVTLIINTYYLHMTHPPTHMLIHM